MAQHRSKRDTPPRPTKPPVRFDDLPEYVRVEDAARFLGISRGLVYEMVKRGELTGRKFGRLLRIPKAALKS
jgi:excisionase family DNA binding protein